MNEHAPHPEPVEGCPLPDGEYAIVECLGHRTLIGRVCEVERFGAKLCQIEPIWSDGLLPAVYVAGASLYAYTPCTRETAWKRRATDEYQLPAPIRARLAPLAIASAHCDVEDADEDDDHHQDFGRAGRESPEILF